MRKSKGQWGCLNNMAWNQYYWQNAKWPLESGDELTFDHFEDIRKWIWILWDIRRGTYYYNYEVDTFWRDEHNYVIHIGDVEVVWKGHRWKNRIEIPKNGMLSIMEPPSDIHPSPGVWVTSNLAWEMVVDEDYYHNYDKNSPKKVIHTSTRGSEFDIEYGYTLILDQINQEGWKQLPRQLDPIENLKPIVYQDTGNLRWQRKGKVEIDRRYVTQPQSLGAVFTNFALCPLVNGHYVRTVDFIDWSLITPDPHICFVYGNQYAHDRNECGNFATGDDLLPQYMNDPQQWYWNPKMCDAYQNFVEAVVSKNGNFKLKVDSTYKENWSAWTGVEWSEEGYTDSDGRLYMCSEYADISDPWWGCNGSGFELLLKKIGHFDWYFDHKNPYIPTTFMEKMQEQADARGVSLNVIMHEWGLMDYDSQTGTYTSRIKGTWRRTWKRSMGRVCSYVQVPGGGNFKEYFLMRPQEMGEPDTDLWNGSKWPFGIFTTEVPTLDEGFTRRYTIAAIENNYTSDNSILVIGEEVGSKFKAGSEVWIEDSNGQVWILYVISAWEKDGSTYVHVDEKLTGGPIAVGDKIYVDDYLSDRHDPVQIEYKPEWNIDTQKYDYEKIWEYEIHHEILNDMFDVLKLLKYIKLPNMSIIKRMTASLPVRTSEDVICDLHAERAEEYGNFFRDIPWDGATIEDPWGDNPGYEFDLILDGWGGALGYGAVQDSHGKREGEWVVDSRTGCLDGTAFAMKVVDSTSEYNKYRVYSRGEEVLYNGKKYRSIIDNNNNPPTGNGWISLWMLSDTVTRVLVPCRWTDQEERWNYHMWQKYRDLPPVLCDGKDGNPLMYTVGNYAQKLSDVNGVEIESKILPKGTEDIPWKYGEILCELDSDKWIEMVPQNQPPCALWYGYDGNFNPVSAHCWVGAILANFGLLSNDFFGEVDFDQIPERCWYRNDKWYNPVTDEIVLGYLDAVEPEVEPPWEDTEPPQPDPPGFNHTPEFSFREEWEGGEHVGYYIVVGLVASLCEDLDGSNPVEYRVRVKDETGEYLSEYEPFNWQTNRAFYAKRITGTLPLSLGTEARTKANGETWRTDMGNPNLVAIPISDTSKINRLNYGTHVKIDSGILAGTHQIISYGEDYIEIFTGLYSYTAYTFEDEIIKVLGATYGQSDWEIDPYKEYGFAFQARDSQNNIGKESNYRKHEHLPSRLPIDLLES